MCIRDRIRTVAPAVLRSKVDSANDMLRRSGAHYAIEDIGQLPQAILDIEERLKKGDRP